MNIFLRNFYGLEQYVREFSKSRSSGIVGRFSFGFGPILCYSSSSYGIYPLFKSHFMKIVSPIAKGLLRSLSLKNPYLSVSKPSPIIEFLREAKKDYENHIIFIRNGDLYECFGEDAVLVVEYSGLLPLGSNPHVEFHSSKLQDTLDTLTTQGFEVAIYEEIMNSNISCDDSSVPMIQRYLIFSQAVSKESPKYRGWSDNIIPADSNNFGVVIGIAHEKGGFSVSVIFPKEKVIKIHERLTMSSALRLIGSIPNRVMLLQDNRENVKLLFKMFPYVVHHQTIQGVFDAKGFHNAACDNVAKRLNIDTDFTLVKAAENSDIPLSLDNETATVLGLRKKGSDEFDKDFKGLHTAILPENAASYMKKYMRLLLSHPPPREIYEKIKYINTKLGTLNIAISQTRPLSTSTLHATLYGSNANINFLREIHKNLKAFIYYDDSLPDTLKKNLYAVTLHDLGLNSKFSSLRNDVMESIKLIESFIILDEAVFSQPSTGISSLDKVFVDMEFYRGMCHEQLFRQYQGRVNNAATELIMAVASEYIGYQIDDSEFNGLQSTNQRRIIATRYLAKYMEKNLSSSANLKILLGKDFIALDILNGSVDHTKFYTKEILFEKKVVRCFANHEVERIFSNYRNICTVTSVVVNQIILSVSRMLYPYAQSIVIVSHFLVVLQTFASHASMAISNGWNLPNVVKKGEISLKELRSPFISLDEAISINLKFRGLCILTGANNCGKSTLLISLLAVCLLSNTGLYSPCSSVSQIPAFNKYLYYSNMKPAYAGSNSPLEDVMYYLEYIFSHASEDSLVLIDSPGICTSPVEGGGILRVIMDELTKRGCTGLVATHLHHFLHSNDTDPFFYRKLTKLDGKLLFEDGIYSEGSLKYCSIDSDFFKALQKKIGIYMLKYLNNQDMDMDRKDTPKVEHEAVKSSVLYKDNGYTTSGVLSVILKNVPERLFGCALAILQCLDDLGFCCLENDAIHLFPNTVPPPLYNNTPVLYAMLIPIEVVGPIKRDESATDKRRRSGPQRTAVYVGETGNIGARIKKHRSKKSGSVDEYLENTYMQHEREMTEYLSHKNKIYENERYEILNWAKSHALLVKVKSRKESKTYERRLIKKLYGHSKRLIILSHRDSITRDIPFID